jgi:hypothetical protein
MRTELRTAHLFESEKNLCDAVQAPAFVASGCAMDFVDADSLRMGRVSFGVAIYSSSSVQARFSSHLVVR